MKLREIQLKDVCLVPSCGNEQILGVFNEQNDLWGRDFLFGLRIRLRMTETRAGVAI